MSEKRKPRKRASVHPWTAWSRNLPPIPGYDPLLTAGKDDWFDPDAADEVIDFFARYLKHIEGAKAGEPFILEPCQKTQLGCLFGWKAADGYRRYNEAFFYEPRGQGKTPKEAGISLYLLGKDGETGAQIYFVAADGEQAGLAYRHARGMVEGDEVLSSACQVFKGQTHRAIVLNSDQNSAIRVVSSDAGGKHGYNPHAVLGDELHAWKDFELLHALETAFAKKGRRQPLKLWFTTADYDRPSPCNDKYDYAVSVRDNPGDPARPGYDRRFLPIIYEAMSRDPKTGAMVEDDWTSEKSWEKANPLLDITVNRESLRAECQRAKEQPSYQAEFKRLHLNIRTTSRTVFIPLERWDSLGDPEALKARMDGRPIAFGGLDVSSKIDLTAFALVFPPVDGDPRYAIHVQCFMPRGNLRERGLRDKVPYETWAQQGWITLTDGNMIDQEFIEEAVKEAHTKYQLESVGFDTWNIAGMDVRLRNYGVNMKEVPQNINRLTAGTKGMINFAADGKLLHDNNPVLRWAVSNTETQGNNNENIRPVKPEYNKTGKRIDPVVATVMAIGEAVGTETVEAGVCFL